MSNQWTLVLETSVPQATLLLACGDEIITRAEFSSERSQEVDLFSPLTEILTSLPDGQSLSAVVIGTGPGSYNGARVGIAAGQAIAQAHGCGVAGLCSFEGVPELKWAVGDARRGSFFMMEIGKEPELLEHEEFLARLSRCEGMKGSFEPVEKLKLGDQEVKQVTPTSEGLLAAWRSRSEGEKKQIMQTPAEAFYLRPPHITVSKKTLF